MGFVRAGHQEITEAEWLAADDGILSEYSVGQRPPLKPVSFEQMVGDVCKRYGEVEPQSTHRA